jgi:hypothetical protein
MPAKSAILALMLLAATLASTPSAADAPRIAEAPQIEFLIRSVEQLPNATFVRNGTPYDARTAADHLRMKWREAGDRIQTVDDFIRVCGAKSWMSGRPYEIRFADGKTVSSEAFLRAKLKEFAPRKP